MYTSLLLQRSSRRLCHEKPLIAKFLWLHELQLNNNTSIDNNNNNTSVTDLI